MGAWGAGAFENDDAADWLAELAGSNDEWVLTTALDAALDTEEGAYVEAPEASIALAAAEVVAAAIGAPAIELPPEVTEWVAKHMADVRPPTHTKAYEATGRIAENSELSELWDESDARDDWRAAVADLQQRLAVAAEP